MLQKIQLVDQVIADQIWFNFNLFLGFLGNELNDRLGSCLEHSQLYLVSCLLALYFLNHSSDRIETKMANKTFIDHQLDIHLLSE